MFDFAEAFSLSHVQGCNVLMHCLLLLLLQEQIIYKNYILHFQIKTRRLHYKYVKISDLFKHFYFLLSIVIGLFLNWACFQLAGSGADCTPRTKAGMN